MELIITLVSKLAAMLLYVVVGYIIVKAGVLSAEESKPFSKLVVYVLQPCLIVSAFQIEVTPERLRGFLAVLVFSSLIYLVWIVLTKVFKKPFGLTRIDEATLVYSNVGNLVLPLIEMTLGREMVFYASAVQIPFNLLIWTHGYQTIRGEKGFHIKGALTNTNVIAIFVGLILMITGVRIPDIPATALQGFSSMVGPASMLVVGMVITQRDLRSVFTFKKAWLILAGRLVVFPLVAILLLFVSGFLRNFPAFAPMLMAGMMSLSAPPSSTVSQLAVVYDVEPVESSIYNVLGTFVCIVTMPAVIALFQAVFM